MSKKGAHKTAGMAAIKRAKNQEMARAMKGVVRDRARCPVNSGHVISLRNGGMDKHILTCGRD